MDLIRAKPSVTGTQASQRQHNISIAVSTALIKHILRITAIAVPILTTSELNFFDSRTRRVAVEIIASYQRPIMRTLRPGHSKTVKRSSATERRSPHDAHMVGADAETWSLGLLSDLWRLGPIGWGSLGGLAAGVLHSVSLPLCETTGTPFSRSSSIVDVPGKTKTPEERAMTLLPDILEVLRIDTEPDPATNEGMSRALTSESSMDDVYLRLMDWSHVHLSPQSLPRIAPPYRLLLCTSHCSNP